jgi:cation transport regulator ChaB
MPKRPARARDSDDQSEEVEDVMAWGSSKQNYYKDSDNEYSSLEEE